MVTLNNTLLLTLVRTSGFFDLKERKIPNKITFTGILIGILFNIITGGWMGFMQSILGMFVGLAIFFLPFVMGGMGAGDVKLMGAIGALMGWRFSLVTALYSALVGGVMVLIYLIYTGKLKDTLKKMILALISQLFHIFEPNGLQQNNRSDPATLRQRWANVQENLYSLRRCHRGRNRAGIAGIQSRDPYFLMKEGGRLEAVIKITEK